MLDKDHALLTHMLESAREALDFATGKELEDYVSNRVLVLATVKLLEIVGEAATKITAETQRSLPGLPWRLMTGMRHKLVHDYMDIDPEIVWATLKDDVPQLIAVLESILEHPSDVL